MNDFPVVPVALVVLGLGGLLYLGTRKSKTEPEDRSQVPVYGGGGAGPSGITAGTVFTADLSGTLNATNPATNAPNSAFTALGSVDESGVHQGFQAFVRARHNVTGEVVDVPVTRIKNAGGAGTGRLYAGGYFPAYAG